MANHLLGLLHAYFNLQADPILSNLDGVAPKALDGKIKTLNLREALPTNGLIRDFISFLRLTREPDTTLTRDQQHAINEVVDYPYWSRPDSRKPFSSDLYDEFLARKQKPYKLRNSPLRAVRIDLIHAAHISQDPNDRLEAILAWGGSYKSMLTLPFMDPMMSPNGTLEDVWPWRWPQEKRNLRIQKTMDARENAMAAEVKIMTVIEVNEKDEKKMLKTVEPEEIFDFDGYYTDDEDVEMSSGMEEDHDVEMSGAAEDLDDADGDFGNLGRWSPMPELE